ncbi:endonuclease/exonuclease/phosphatase [Arsukibacterium sp. MJ3]|uniref:ExeM/NucH family extracellular endonuclease n=1 Tax=Arsukibacterium sp. MJ3 TaxID=1632859 RepID=UPI0006271CD3|nr:ExeM/NucH family extracellular endonuclease [Arsukibacterium sp. MJ3]KKO48005.1 endonuclease/exonuclease/phosphatase [Arsukibacterium sp. MJ3]
MKIRILSATIAMLLAPAVHADLFISEYIEGSSNNKALEFFNPTAASIDLAPYAVKVYFNGNVNVGTTINLQGIVPANSTFVYASSNAAAALVALADQTSGQSLWNGDDAITLTKNDSVIDSIGQIGVDPGSAWGSGDITTANDTLRRNAVSYDIDPTDSFDPAAQWAGFPQDDFSDIGLFNGSGGGPGDPEPEPEPDPVLICGNTATAIFTIQGSGAASPLLGEVVQVEAVVTQTLPGLRGFNVQAVGAEQDADPATSEGVFVFVNSSDIGVTAGQRVRLLATVAEFNGHTQLTNVSATLDCGVSELPAATLLTLPVASLAELEAVEGMLVRFEQALTVNDTFTLGRFGELTLANGRRYTPTQVVAPGADAIALAAAQRLNRIILDDNSTVQNPAQVPYPAPGLSAANPVRGGDTIVGLTGTLHYSFSEYRIMPSEPVTILADNPRTAAPTLHSDGNVKVASFNVLNYFNGDGLGGGFPTARGANSAFEFERQREKILAALAAMDATVIGLMELENDGFASTSAIADLVDGLREASGQPQWQFVQTAVSPIGTDQITVGLLYRADLLQPVEAARLLDSNNSALDDAGQPLFDDNRNRPMMAQRFRLIANDAEFVVMVNHLKSKGSGCGAADGDNGDGQGNCNISRTRAAQAIGIFADEHYADIPAMVIGDLNAYAKEDPITTLAQAGYYNVFEALDKADSYGYVFQGLVGSLDHALLNQSALDVLADAAKWNINADEPIALDYNVEFKTEQQIYDYYAPDAYRSSDHDPVIVALQLAPVYPPLTATLELIRVNRGRSGATLVQLRWSSDAEQALTLYRDDSPVAMLSRPGRYNDQFKDAAINSVTYRLCLDATAQCSEPLVINF